MQFSHRSHPVDVCKIRLRLAQRLQGLFRLLALNGDIRKINDLADQTMV